MGKIFCLMGKSATGKDTIYAQLFERNQSKLKKIISYTTRPIREGEEPGREYIFCDEDKLQCLMDAGKIIEHRTYQTVYGPWHYFTADDGQFDLNRDNYLTIGTLEMYLGLASYFGKEKVLPIYVEVEDGERLMRAIAREQSQCIPKYEEMCRRFLADAADFADEKLISAGISMRFVNDSVEETVQQIEDYIAREVANGN